MSFSMFDIAQGAEKSAQATKGAASQPTFVESMVPFLPIFVAMYFLMIRPQAKKAKEHTSLMKSLKPGDEVVTSGGIIGKVRSVAEEFVSVDTGSGTLKVLKENISRQTKQPTTAKEKYTVSSYADTKDNPKSPTCCLLSHFFFCD